MEQRETFMSTPLAKLPFILLMICLVPLIGCSSTPSTTDTSNPKIHWSQLIDPYGPLLGTMPTNM